MSPRLPTIAACTLALLGVAHAVPVPGQGTWETVLHARDLNGDQQPDAWYDSSRDRTWLADADPLGLVTWWQARDWAATLVVHGVGGWRLPAFEDIGEPGCWGYTFDGSGDCGYNSNTDRSELAHMWHTVLGNLSWADTSGQGPQPGWGLTNTGPFANLRGGDYWTATTDLSDSPWDPGNPDYGAWLFQTQWGYHDSDAKAWPMHAWVLRDGDVAPIPEPATWALWAAGLAALGWRRRRRAAAGAATRARPLAAAALLAACGAAAAAPVSLQFTLPDWEIRNPAGELLYGTNATLRVTVDNGNASTALQAWAFGDILEVFVSSGAYANSWLAGDAYINTDPGYAIFFSDAAGVPSLDLTPEPDPGQRIVFSNAGGTWAFGLGRSDNGVYTAVWLQDGPQFTGDARAFSTDYGDTVVVGAIVEPRAVPLPSSALLAGLGLAGIACTARRRPGGQRATRPA